MAAPGRAVRQLYPPDEAGPARRRASAVVGSVQPDLLAEKHATSQLAADHRFAAACLADLTPDQAGEALTALTQGYSHDERAAEQAADHPAGPLVPTREVFVR